MYDERTSGAWHLATPRLVADENQKTVWRWDNQEPFGNNPANEDPDGDGVAFEFPMRFPGQYADRETGLAYNYYRDYSPDIGRYVESDPVGLVAGLNTYSYVGASPLVFSDPKGLIFPFDCIDCLEKLKQYNDLVEQCRKSYERYCYNQDGSLDQKRLMNFLQLYGAGTDSAAILNCAQQLAIQVYGRNFMSGLASCQKCSLGIPKGRPLPR